MSCSAGLVRFLNVMLARCIRLMILIVKRDLALDRYANENGTGRPGLGKASSDNEQAIPVVWNGGLFLLTVQTLLSGRDQDQVIAYERGHGIMCIDI